MADNDANPVSEVVDLVKTYAMQETIEPLKPVARFVGFGAAGAALMGVGILLLSLALLRGLQTIDFFDGNWSILAYGIVSLIVLAIAGLLGQRIMKGV